MVLTDATTDWMYFLSLLPPVLPPPITPASFCSPSLHTAPRPHEGRGFARRHLRHAPRRTRFQRPIQRYRIRLSERPGAVQSPFCLLLIIELIRCVMLYCVIITGLGKFQNTLT